MLYPKLGAVKGVEYLPQLANSAREGVKLFKASVDDMAPTEIIEADLFETSWEDANIVYCNNAVFPPEMNERLANDL